MMPCMKCEDKWVVCGRVVECTCMHMRVHFGLWCPTATKCILKLLKSMHEQK